MTFPNRLPQGKARFFQLNVKIHQTLVVVYKNFMQHDFLTFR